MKDHDSSGDCGCWTVDLPPRKTDFADACACDERGRRRIGRRVRLTLAGLALCVLAGVAAGVVFARSTDSANLAALRERYLTNVENGGTGR